MTTDPENGHQPSSDLPPTSLVRPYVITGGRTRSSSDDLPIETMVRVTESAATTSLDFEREAIAARSVEPISIAELASALDLPLGVARVLASDMASEGLLHTGEAADPNDIALLTQLIEGIRAL